MTEDKVSIIEVRFWPDTLDEQVASFRSWATQQIHECDGFATGTGGPDGQPPHFVMRDARGQEALLSLIRYLLAIEFVRAVVIERPER